ncbi:MAG: cytochrome c3 family protein [Bacteroidales bacterium]
MKGRRVIKISGAKLIILLSGIIFFGETNGYSNNYNESAYEENGHSGGQKHSIERGKRLFFGLVATESGKAFDCVSCHNINIIDTLNWNPSALDIALSTADLDSLSFANLVLNPVTPKSVEAHEGISLTGEELQFIRAYMEDVAHTGLEKPKPVLGGILLFLGLTVLFILALTDLIVIKYIKKSYIHMVILLITSVWITKILVEEGWTLGKSQDYAPLQPIKFSHKVHAGDQQIDCQYCHSAAEFSKTAGFPAANLCLNCHILVRDGSNSGRFEINKIHNAVDSMNLIEWIRIHRLPDHVFFSHAQHVGVAKLDCQECHGPVEEMHVVGQFADLSMGWCLDCHRTKKVDFLENDYYGMTFESYHDKIISGEIDSVTVADLGGTDCMKCHY